jgi:hypothetical protein
MLWGLDGYFGRYRSRRNLNDSLFYTASCVSYAAGKISAEDGDS